MSSMIVEFWKLYGWQLTLLACSGIVFLGALKSVGVFKKLPVNIKKYVYFGVSAFVSLVACTVYILAIHKFSWKNYAILFFGVIGITGGIYTVYENTGFRAFLKKFVFSPIKKLLKTIWIAAVNNSLTEDTVKGLALNLGVDVIKEIEKQAEAKAAEVKEEQAQPAEAEKVVEKATPTNVIITESK